MPGFTKLRAFLALQIKFPRRKELDCLRLGWLRFPSLDQLLWPEGMITMICKMRRGGGGRRVTEHTKGIADLELISDRKIWEEEIIALGYSYL